MVVIRGILNYDKNGRFYFILYIKSYFARYSISQVMKRAGSGSVWRDP
jgi:hypothetical protein